MKYIYYIAAFVIIFSALVGYGLLSSNISVSKPAITINDRIISEDELQGLLDRKPVHMSRDQHIESLILNELLIQEAIRQEINQEESFRQSVENYYEQSLVKILLDRQFDSFDVAVSKEEIEKYRQLMQSRVTLVKTVYPDKESESGDVQTAETRITHDFVDLSDEMKYIVFKLDEGESTGPMDAFSGKEFDTGGTISYTLEKVEPADSASAVSEADTERITRFLTDKKKEEHLDSWTQKLRDNADIWRK